MKKNISENIRFIRESLGYSQEYIASKLQLTQQAYSNIEKNPEKTTLKKLKEIARVLDVDFITLINEDSTYVQQNFNQQGGNAATKMNLTSSLPEKEIYSILINQLKEEITFLRNQLSTK
jgi:transcriptional regulator with XRE-family HTH domain